jgi:hypothetical protein
MDHGRMLPLYGFILMAGEEVPRPMNELRPADFQVGQSRNLAYLALALLVAVEVARSHRNAVAGTDTSRHWDTESAGTL